MKSSDVEQIGRKFTSGVLRELGKWLIIALIAMRLFQMADDEWHITNRDSTDAAHRHSGLRLRTDAWTGCQYLESQDGALTPRLGADGHQLCTGDHQ